jgi:hypothetical protein
VPFCGGSGLLSERSEREEVTSFYGGSRRARRGHPSTAEADEREEGILRRRKQTSAKKSKECPSAAEARCVALGLEGAQPRSVLLRRKRAVSLGGCRGETPRTPPAAGEVALAAPRARFMWAAPRPRLAA